MPGVCSAQAVPCQRWRAPLPVVGRVPTIQASLADDLWLRNARQANEMAARLAGLVVASDQVELVRPPEANAVMARIPWGRLDELQSWSFFWPWDPADSQVRWMTGFATAPADVDAFAAGVAAILAQV